jgi:hypothetical protein
MMPWRLLIVFSLVQSMAYALMGQFDQAIAKSKNPSG